MDFPAYAKNTVVETQPLTISVPEIEDTDTAEERWLKQQWKDVQESGVAEMHPLSINRDSANVTGDPYTS
jgi:hypothetical protein